MAGRGPRPKDPTTRARRNADPVPTRHLAPDATPASAPDLPSDVEWHPRTLAWWETWRSSGQAAELTATDWDFLLDTALLHTKFWNGNDKVASELRLRVAKFGATPEDRARLRWEAERPEEPATPERKRPSARERYGDLLRVVGSDITPEE